MLKLLIKQNEENRFGFLCVQEESRNTQGEGLGQGENPVFRITKKYVPLNR